jgi:hypothetical protein
MRPIQPDHWEYRMGTKTLAVLGTLLAETDNAGRCGYARAF